MPALNRNLTIEQGTTWTAGWLVRNSADQTPLYGPGCTVRAQVRQQRQSPEVLHEWSTAAGNAIIDGDGTIILSVAPAVSSAWTWTYGAWDLEVTRADGTVDRVLEGQVGVSSEVTR